jgi:hypothetical protein
MADVEQVLREYIREHRSEGEADPLAYLARVDEGADRLELEALIDAYLERAPRAEFEAEAFAASRGPAVVAAIEADLDAAGESWRALLPRLRTAAQLKRSDLVAQLAERLGVRGREDKVGRYYNAMEHEQLDPAGISERVYDVLASVVNTSADALRRAAPKPPDDTVADMAFARSAPWETDSDAVAAAPALAQALDEPEWDEVDELFRGG